MTDTATGTRNELAAHLRQFGERFADPRAALGRGMHEPSTLRMMEQDWRRYAAWCRREERDPYLVDDGDQLARHLLFMMTQPSQKTGRTFAPATIRRASATICMHLESEGRTPPPRLIARRLLDQFEHALSVAQDERALPTKAAPLLPEQLRACLHTLERTSMVGARNAAILLGAVEGALRASELVSLDIEKCTEHEWGVLVQVYRRKVRLWQTLQFPWKKSDAHLCAATALVQLLRGMHAMGRTSGPLLVNIDRHGRLGTRGKDPSGRLSTRAVHDVVKQTAAAAGLDPQRRWSTHSGRRGFVTQRWLEGVDWLAISRGGGWSPTSKALPGYADDPATAGELENAG